MFKKNKAIARLTPKGAPIGLLLLLSLFVLPARSETTLYLRYGGPESAYKVADASQTSPIVMNVPGHNFQNGDIIYVSMVRGNLAANGPHQIDGVNGNSFRLLDLSGKPTVASGPYDGGGTVGLARATTVVPSPRILLDGPGGVLTSRVKDPDGPGRSRAPAADNLAYGALQKRYDSRFRKPAYTEPSSGDSVLAAAIGWLIDNSNTLYLNTARDWINNVEKYVGYQSTSPFFGTCNEHVANCGSASGAFLDWSGFWAANWSMGYNLIRSELSDGERRAFAAKMLNGMFGDSCENRLQQGRGTVTLTQGGNVVRGNGTNFSAIPSPAGRWFQVTGGKIYGTWVLIDSVVSDTELRLRSPSPISAEDKAWWWEGDWAPASCGYLWWSSHHAFTPRVLTREGQTTLVQGISPGATEIRVANGAAFPQRVPFHAQIGSEWVKVVKIEQNVLTVERAQFGGSAKTAAARGTITSTDFPPSGGMSSVSATALFPLDAPQNNLNFSKIYSTITIGLAVIEDDPRAGPLVEATWNYWFDTVYTFSKSRWAGVTQGGYSYGPPRWQNWTYSLAAIGATSFSPPIDVTAGNWLKDLLVYPVFGMLPWNSRRAVMFADAGSEDLIFSRWYWHIYIANYLVGDSKEFGYANFWLRQMNKWYSETELQSPNGFNSIPYALIYTQPSSACPSKAPRELCVDPSETLDPHYFFTNPDYRPPGQPDNAFNVVVSRQNWNPDSTFLWMQAFGMDVSDHLGSYPTPGSYRIARKQWLLANGPLTIDAGALDRGNYVEVDGPGGIALPVGAGSNSVGTIGVVASVDRKFGNRDYTYWRVNSSHAFKQKSAVSRHYRSFLHLKAGPQDYVIVYDDVATKTPKSKAMRLHYYADNSEKGTLARVNNSIVYTRSQSRISTQILLPNESSKLSESTAAFANNRSNVTTVVVDDGNTDSSEFLVVHRPSGSTTDTMPPTRLFPAVSPGFTGVVIEDPARPRLALFPRNGSVSIKSATATVPPLPAPAQMVILGLAPGIYELKRDGVVLSAEMAVGLDGSFSTSADGGATYELRLVASQALELRVNAGASLPDAQRLKPYSHRLIATGSVAPYRWSLLGGAFPAGITLSEDGTLSGTPTEEGSFQFSVAVTDSSQPQQTIEVPLTLLVAPVKDELFRIVTQSLPDAILDEPYELQLEAAGGAGPYRWAAAGDLPEGFFLSEDGVLSGFSSVLASELAINVECYDQSSPSNVVAASFFLSVVLPDVPEE